MCECNVVSIETRKDIFKGDGRFDLKGSDSSSSYFWKIILRKWNLISEKKMNYKEKLTIERWIQ